MIKKIQQKFGQCICRRCINRLCGAKLERKNCIYASFPATCPACDTPQNIVVGFRLGGRIKLIGKRLQDDGDNESQKSRKNKTLPE